MTATSAPLSLALYTCAMLPDAMGLESKASKICSTGLPSSRWIWAWVWAQLCSGALACRTERAEQSSEGKMSGRVEAHWPHLMKAAPDTAMERESSQNQTCVRNRLETAARPEVSKTGEKMSMR